VRWVDIPQLSMRVRLFRRHGSIIGSSSGGPVLIFS
jgi:hypothetical protein